MEFFTLFIIICTIYCVFYFFDIIFKSCSHYPYITFLQKTGLNVGFFRISWFTTAFNRNLFYISTFWPKFLQKWFCVGTFVTILLVPASFILLLTSIHETTKMGKVTYGDQGLTLEPMLPGINLPVLDTGYYFITIAVCSIIHEMGHALAAFKEGVQVTGVGIIIVFIIPIAYVNLNTEQLSSLNPKRQLRIFCAGIWHNVVLSVMAYLFLFIIPFLSSFLYELGRGVHVLDVNQDSKVVGPNGIFPGDKLVAINDCEVSDQESWHQCLSSFGNIPTPGYCVSEDIIHQLDESVPLKLSDNGELECCSNSSGHHLCFEALEDGNPLQILQYTCLPGRPIVAGTAYSCSDPKDCPPGLHCIRPVTPTGTTLLRIQRSRGNVVIYIGSPGHVAKTVQVSDYVQIFELLPPKIPEMVIRLTKYFILFSSGFAVMNAIPCFYLDGNHITNSLVNYVFRGRSRTKKVLAITFNILGTILLVVDVFCAVWKHYSNNF